MQTPPDAFVARLSASSLGMADMLTMYIGDRLQLYAALQHGGPLTSTELAARANIHERYAREWLEQQAVSGVLDVVDPSAPADQRRYALPAAHAEVLLDRDSLNYTAPSARWRRRRRAHRSPPAAPATRARSVRG